MAITRKVIRVKNPRRFRSAKGRFVKKSKMNRRKNTRKRSTTPHIRRVSVKLLKKELKRRGVRVNPRATRRKRVTVIRRKRHLKRRTVRQNPALIELGAVNPRRRTHVAKPSKHRKSNPRRRRHAKAVVLVHRRRRRSNPVVHRRRRRRANPIMRTRRSHHRRRNVRHYSRRRRRNPAIFGSSGGKDLLMMVGGGLVGVAATKYLPTLIPGSITAGLGASPIMSVLIMGAGAFAAGYLARRFVGGKFGDAVLFGGLMQTGSALLTAFAPGPLRGFALSGIGDIMPGYFPVPQNSITGHAPMAIVPAGGGGMGSFRRAFGGQR